MSHTNEIPTVNPIDAPERNWTNGYIRAATVAVLVHVLVSAILILGHWTSAQLLSFGTWIYASGVLAGAIFLVAYTVLAKWWKTPIGVLFELIGVAIVTTGIVVLATLFLGQTYPGREHVRIIGYLLFTDSSVGILITYLIERRSRKPVIPVPTRRKSR